MVIWLTGLSGAGKTTIAKQIFELVKPHKPETILVDGDIIRELFGNDLGFSEKDRIIQINRIQRLSLFLSDQGFCVIVAALYSNPELLKWNRESLPYYFEIYVDTPFDVIKQRDSKGLYSKASKGSIDNVVGLDIPWHKPTHSDLTVVSDGVDPTQLAREVIQKIPKLDLLSWK